MIGHGVPGLNIQQEHAYPVAPSVVFAALTDGLNQWWPRSWRQFPSQGTMSLSAQIDAKMTESAAGGAQAIWGWVDRIVPHQSLHLQGSFGIASAVAGRVQYDIDPQDQGCILRLLHQVIGPIPEDKGVKYRAAWRDALDTDLRSYLRGALV